MDLMSSQISVWDLGISGLGSRVSGLGGPGHVALAFTCASINMALVTWALAGPLGLAGLRSIMVGPVMPLLG